MSANSSRRARGPLPVLRGAARLWVAIAAVLGPASATAADPPADPPCHTAPAPASYTRAEVRYQVPAIALVDQAARPFASQSLAESDRPVVLNFVFATCTTICPVMTATFAAAQRELGADASRVRFVSITIDPEHDTPAVLSEYARRFPPPDDVDWTFVTGPSADVQRVLQAFDAWSGSKLAHRPITLLRRPGSDTWIRLEGLGSGKDLATEIRSALAP